MKELATKCLGNIVRSAEEGELFSFKKSIPLIFDEIFNFSEETVLHIYETLCDFHTTSLSFFGDYIDNILDITIKLVTSEKFSGRAKLVISEFLTMICDFDKKKFQKNGCQKLKQVLELAFKLASLPNEELIDEEEDDFSSK